MPDYDGTSNDSSMLEPNLINISTSSPSNSLQNFSLPSTSSSVSADQSGINHSSAMALRENNGEFRFLSAISTPGSSSQDNKRRRAPDMQLGKCRWIRVYDNVTYIVAGIILRESPTNPSSSPEILLIQEAKKKCRGKWYIPAGHVEPGETIEQACKREVLEETGYECSVNQLICMETRGSGWYRMSFSCQITGGRLKAEPDRESLAAGWHSIADIQQKRPSNTTNASDKNGCTADVFQLRCRDFLPILEEALKYREWCSSVPKHILEARSSNLEADASASASMAEVNALEMEKFAPILNRNEAQPGLFIEFVIIKWSSTTEKTECLVHGSVNDQSQLLNDSFDAFPIVEFGFEFFFPMVVSKCYRHIFEDGHQAIDLPEAVLAMWCLPAPIESVRQGLRLRILCRHKRAVSKAPLCVPQRYHWIALEDERVLAHLHLLPGQFRPALFML